MPYFTTQIDNIQSIFQTWENLSEPNKSMRINHILPFLQLASIINALLILYHQMISYKKS